MRRIFFACALIIFLPVAALAADLSVQLDDIVFSSPKPLAGEIIRIYVTVSNTSQHDARANVRFFIDNVKIGEQPVSVLAYKNDAVFIDWAPMEGYYNIKVDIVDIEPADATLENNSVVINDFIVDLDTDGDGQYNADDWDDDNDGVDDGVELSQGTDPTRIDTDGDGAGDGVDQFPLDPNEKYDNDGDGIGNNADEDNDNDGVLNGDDPAPFNPNITGKEVSSPVSEPEPAQAPVQEPEPYVAPKPSEQTQTPEPEPEPVSEPESEYAIEPVEYTFPDQSEADYALDVMIAKSRINWNEFQFDALGGNESFLYLWDFGDGKFDQTKDIAHKFPGSGEYIVSLSVSDGVGGLGQAQEKIIIGFWNIGNPSILALIILLGAFAVSLAGYLIYQGPLQRILPKNKK
ncbi:MAG: hypothetical protein CO042_02875 [Parcubacteria group bacterium CG_4_9_14_0_2_um_filter_41_8]|nr:MAG: hypothetical protein AUJ34_01535 [Parcubacteria group bacterium CG1_02_41_12]PIP67071.1 MAG: hypothetical protein COW93_02180 [Parcubacteria group bacterium CG22_combo_CG10-13_8_21_14_all_41_9]PIR57422.1 MAG: hypothetical protein COU72_01035 [Parcubacteria group bacterium CG10_big_fil_rev_8_21_14_0_10_41_35]PIZ80131.1 MAG: hypothetical protein COY02_03675 [Parcubacteria group bacterium CG_4_10_14_0_2_um_filter_41_6]PJC40622.1 MAG: hypothetical protein CO042_02875 [Parcubacteria group ba